MPDPDPWYRFRISGILRRGARSVECLVQNLMFIWCNRMEETSQSNEIDYTSAFTSNNTEGTGNMSQSNEVDFTSASTSNNTEGTAETSQSDEMDHTSASTSNNAEGTSPKNTEHEFSPAKEVTEALCTEPYNEAWMNNIDERFLKPFKDGQRRPCPHHWSMLFEYETLQVHDELAFKFFPGGDIGVPSQEAEYFACITGLEGSPEIVLLNESGGYAVTEPGRFRTFTGLLGELRKQFGDLTVFWSHLPTFKDVSVRRNGRDIGTLHDIQVNLDLWKQVRKWARTSLRRGGRSLGE
ncbi:MAG: hypothetical protein LQ346_001921 [Caloplaca aetnensis]|nr:MAG: hypothetical protein LQ346_001921 [Caloplaca aetnensis]